MNGWKVALSFAIILSVGSCYEAWAAWMESMHPTLTLTFTKLTKKHTHLMIIVFVVLGVALGYALGVSDAWR